ncbi:MAG TPA: response regulator [Candidatus Omnitrophota bacterium]|nr:response regulator [Candidatus Omnitrophota bacterium]HPS20290.1 response regulator [Candidatus Omnitrophota bacterium]
MVKLMVVDDEIEICDFVKIFFQERNFEVFAAYNGKEALALIETRSPDIILLDLKMPVMDGMQTLKALQNLKRHNKVIMVTAVEDSEKIEEAKKFGAVEYITKPLQLEQLENTVLSLAVNI